MNKSVLLMLLVSLVGTNSMVSPLYAMDENNKQGKATKDKTTGITGQWVADGVMSAISVVPMVGKKLQQSYRYHTRVKPFSPEYLLCSKKVVVGPVRPGETFRNTAFSIPTHDKKDPIGRTSLKNMYLLRDNGTKRLAFYIALGENHPVFTVDCIRFGHVDGADDSIEGEVNFLKTNELCVYLRYGSLLYTDQKGVLRDYDFNRKVVMKCIDGVTIPVTHEGKLLFKSDDGVYYTSQGVVDSQEVESGGGIDQLPTNDAIVYPGRAVFCAVSTGVAGAAGIMYATYRAFKWCHGKLFGKKERNDRNDLNDDDREEEKNVAEQQPTEQAQPVKAESGQLSIQQEQPELDVSQEGSQENPQQQARQSESVPERQI